MYTIIFSIYPITEASWLKKISIIETLKFNGSHINGNVDKLFKTIKHDIVSQKPYLKSILDIKKHSEILEINADFIDAYVTHIGFRSFTKLINFYKVEEFKQRIDSKSNSNYTLIGIATECGFKSKSTFFRVFKDFEDTTPKMFIAKIKSNTL